MMAFDDLLGQIVAAFQELDFVEAARLTNYALEKFADDGPAMEALGLALCHCEDLTGAIRCYERALLCRPLEVKSQYLFSQVLLAKGRRAEALEWLDYLARSLPRVPADMLPDLTRAFGQVGWNDLAALSCQEAALRDPSDHRAIFGIAYYSLRRGGSLRFARGVLQRALLLAPENSWYALHLLQVEYALGDAVAAYRLACQLPDDQWPKLGQSCVRQVLQRLLEEFADHERLRALDDQPLNPSSEESSRE
jgi:tetratricopeptide (TPR) repeat protein